MPAGLIRPRRTTAAACFWLVQFFFGLPSLVQAMILLTTSRAEGALFMIALFLAWIGATLAVIAGTLVHGSAEVSFPAAFATYAFAGPSPATEPEPQATVSKFGHRAECTQGLSRHPVRVPISLHRQWQDRGAYEQG
jgi:hypothetical protein